MQQKEYYLLTDVSSYFAPYRVYGTAGTKVHILHDHLDMMIVQDFTGSILHTRTDNLSETPPGHVPKAQVAIVEKQNSRRQQKKKVAPVTQKNLF